MGKDATQLRYVCSKDPLLLTEWANSRPYKIEIKSIAIEKGKWFCWYCLAAPLGKELLGRDLDG